MKRLIISTLILIVFFGCTNETKKKKVNIVADSIVKVGPLNNGLSQQDSIKATGTQVLTFLKTQKYPELIKYFSSEGVLFSPYGYIDKSISKKLTPDEFLNAIDKKLVLNWGSFDGTGDPIKLTVSDYFKKFAYNADYLNAEAVGFNEIIKQGNSVNNLKDIFPNNYFIDYHFSGFEQKNNGMDWTSLRLVFEKQNGQYFIVAIINDQWTS